MVSWRELADTPQGLGYRRDVVAPGTQSGTRKMLSPECGQDVGGQKCLAGRCSIKGTAKEEDMPRSEPTTGQKVRGRITMPGDETENFKTAT